MQGSDGHAPARIEDRLARGGWAIELLRAPAALFSVASDARALLYDRGWLPSARVDAAVVSVGNLTVGGSGKTPMVAWLVRALSARGRRVGILSRGYGAEAGQPNDEARLLAELAPDAPHVQDRDRVRGAAALVDQQVDAIVLDDGFQHRRLARDLDLVLVDATRPWGLPQREPERAPLLPRGLLRERPSALARATAIVLTRVDQAQPSELVQLRAQIATYAPQVPIACAVHRPSGLRALDGRTRALETLSGVEVDCLSALGAPAAFERTLESLGAKLCERRRLADHHRFSAGDLAGLGAAGRAIVTSAKDATKLHGLAAGRELWVLDVEFDVVEGAAPLHALLDALPDSRGSRERAALHEGLHG